MKMFGREEERAVLEVMRRDPVTLSGYYKNPKGGPSVQAFEKRLAEYIGTSYAVACSSGTSALHLALMALGIGKSDQVITTPLTFSATATSVLMVGAEPVFVDVNPNSYNIDPDRIEERVTEMTKAIIVVHLLGVPADMKAIRKVAEKHNLYVIEDNAQALGAKYRGKMTGSLGDISILSFQETKCITSGGEGGMVLTHCEEFADKAAKLRNHGSQYADAPYLTYNMRMTELQAAFGLAQMEKLDYFNALEVGNAKRFFEELKKADLGIFPQRADSDDYATRYIIATDVPLSGFRGIYIKNLTELGLNKNLPGATIGLGYTRTIMDLPILQRYRRRCPVAEELVKHFLWFDCLRWKRPHEADETIKVLIDTAKEVWK
jgi:dTDP-4-amino-4,6-dideoxygalactose transaminase